MPQDVYTTPLVSMMEPMVEGFDASLKDSLSSIKKNTAVLDQQWNQVINQYQEVRSAVSSMAPAETQAIQHAILADTSMEAKKQRSFKMQMQDDLNSMTEQSNIILILGLIFLFAAMLFVLVSFA